MVWVFSNVEISKLKDLMYKVWNNSTNSNFIDIFNSSVEELVNFLNKMFTIEHCKGHKVYNMWNFNMEEIVKLQNRLNDVENEFEHDLNSINFFRTVDRLIGSIDMFLNVSHYMEE